LSFLSRFITTVGVCGWASITSSNRCPSLMGPQKGTPDTTDFSFVLYVLLCG
jgi:hypothetical protein